METERNVNDELNEIAPGFPKVNPVEVPPDYFEKLPTEILNRWKDEESKRSQPKLMWRRIAAVAAVLLIALTGSWIAFSKTTQPQTTEITAIEAYQYIQENIEDFEGLIETEITWPEEELQETSSDAVEEFLLEELEGADPEDFY